MTGEQLTLIIAGIVTVIGAIVTGTVTIIHAMGELRKRTDEVHTLVDGNASKQQEKLIILEDKLQTALSALGVSQERRVEEAQARPAMESRSNHPVASRPGGGSPMPTVEAPIRVVPPKD